MQRLRVAARVLRNGITSLEGKHSLKPKFAISPNWQCSTSKSASQSLSLKGRKFLPSGIGNGKTCSKFPSITLEKNASA
jgi:hypothetical protein